MATKAQQQRFLNTAQEHQRGVVKNIQSVSRRHGIERAFSDFVEISAITLARLDQTQFDAREARYLQIVGHYDRDELTLLVEAFLHLVMAFERHVHVDDDGQLIAATFSDILGCIYMMLDLGNAGAGQFFTPYEVSLLMAKMTMTDAKPLIEKRGFRLLEPTAGAGGIMIAAAQVLAEEGVNYQQCMHVTAIDIDQRCVHMTYIQCALLHIPAAVIHGNSLADEVRSIWYTPAHILGGWGAKLRANDAQNGARALVQASAVAASPASGKAEGAPRQKGASQMTLF
ncbi:N-6 DNA methylase [Pollutimonas bauzanensis]|uniref:N-6 DNA Methylase n=1 Tax=Pollutimonas bauzanensis TaxID=658167 RepID=A0A1M5YJ82_9BURK|nr:N-6 DNA methylase [Pollutimonas bauzanensis]SHI12076.1 N-6 DNA Methylase [Pollutimonas bauzanensis]